MMTLDAVLALARKHLGTGTMESSARLALADAIALKDAEFPDYEASRSRAVTSLKYSVGIFHDDYQRAAVRRPRHHNY